MNCMMTYITGPHISNAILGTYCSTAHFRLEGAQQKCTDDSTCLFIHDYNCDGWGWRYCSGDVHQIQSLDLGTDACTQVKFVPCTTASITSFVTVTSAKTSSTSFTTVTNTETSATSFSTFTATKTLMNCMMTYITGPHISNAI